MTRKKNKELYILSGEKERNERKKNKRNEKRHGKIMFCGKMSKPK